MSRPVLITVEGDVAGVSAAVGFNVGDLIERFPIGQAYELGGRFFMLVSLDHRTDLSEARAIFQELRPHGAG